MQHPTNHDITFIFRQLQVAKNAFTLLNYNILLYILLIKRPTFALTLKTKLMLRTIAFKPNILLWAWVCISASTAWGQCALPTYNVAIASPASNLTWTPAGTALTGGTRSLITQINTSPTIFMRITYSARSSSAVAIANWDRTTGGYGAAWQPEITVPISTSTTDTSWAEFFIEFASLNGTGSNSFDNNRLIIPCLAMTIIDNDGNGVSSGTNAFREIVQVAAPSNPMGIVGSSVSSGMVGPWVTNVSGVAQFSNIDTINKAAMVQMNFASVTEFHMRVGVVGTRSSSTTRQNCFWFRPFDTMTASLLPVHFQNMGVKSTPHAVLVNWSTTWEEHADFFEVEKSDNGLVWHSFANQKAAGYSTHVNSYFVHDFSPFPGFSFYRIKQVDLDGSFVYSDMLKAYREELFARFTVFPNPFSHLIQVSGGDFSALRLRSHLGAVLASCVACKDLAVEHVPAGMYILEVMLHGNWVQVDKVCKYD
jgi:hypothetical protein